MAQEVTIGGDRLGSGNKTKVELHDYKMNSFNLSHIWRSSMAPGLLYPFVKYVGTNHGTFDIDLATIVRTLPTKGPVFGSFKLQLDIFSVPFRLYQGVLHNNPLEIGLQMNQVYLPKLRYRTLVGPTAGRVVGSNDDDYQVSTNCLLKYLGFSGAGSPTEIEPEFLPANISRKINAVPALAYYDIFKCYYSNKQEKKAYIVTPGSPRQEKTQLVGLLFDPNNGTSEGYTFMPYEDGTNITTLHGIGEGNTVTLTYKTNFKPTEEQIQSIMSRQVLEIMWYAGEDDTEHENTLKNLSTENYIKNLTYKVNDNSQVTEGQDTNYTIQIEFEITKYIREGGTDYSAGSFYANVEDINFTYYNTDIHLEPFNLANIDKMRYELLNHNELGYEYMIGHSGDWDYNSTEDHGLPYTSLVLQTESGISYNAFKLNGLVTKTYQSDMYTSFLSSTYVDEITYLTRINTNLGYITQDDLILNEKIYELLNRVLVSNGTYQGWQDAVYGEGAVRQCETPMYIGGMSAEIGFDEVISNAETSVNGNKSPLGTLGGRGRDTDHQGGQSIHVTMKEPGYVMGIVSITPRISYSQGNDWDLTEIDTLDDLHKPELDQIGFQEIPSEQVAWWTTQVNSDNPSNPVIEDLYGMTTAWMNYQTAVDKCYGDFADQEGYSFMVLNRNYEHNGAYYLKDKTSYIDPAKFNYAFAVDELYAQNFWVSIKINCVARRKMGAQQLPML